MSSAARPTTVNTEIAGEYIQWCIESLGISLMPNQEVRSLPSESQVPEEDERGIFASDNIAKGSLLCSIPFASLFSLETLDEKLRGFVSSNVEMSLREDDILAVALIVERQRGKESKWHKHMNLLPKLYHTVLYFDGIQLEALKGSNLYELAKQLQRQVAGDFERIAPAVFTLFSELFPDVDAKTAFTQDSFKWAISTIWSRFITVVREGKQLRVMAPYMDFYNHKPQAKMQHGFHPASDSLVCQALQEWKKGEEICLNYGALPNSKLLMLYGFVLPHLTNPSDGVQLWATMSPDAPDYNLKTQIMKRHSIDDRLPFELRAGGLNANLLAALRIQRMSDGELPKAEQAFEGQILSEANERLVLKTLKGALEGMLEGYATTLEQDMGMLDLWSSDFAKAEDLPVPKYHEQMAVQLRRGEKAILKDNLEKLVAHLAAVGDDAGDDAAKADDGEAGEGKAHAAAVKELGGLDD